MNNKPGDLWTREDGIKIVLSTKTILIFWNPGEMDHEPIGYVENKDVQLWPSWEWNYKP